MGAVRVFVSKNSLKLSRIIRGTIFTNRTMIEETETPRPPLQCPLLFSNDFGTSKLLTPCS